MTSPIYKKEIKTPIGQMIVCATREGILFLHFSDYKHIRKILDDIQKNYHSEFIEEEISIITDLKKQLQEYFWGKRRQFTIPLVVSGSQFQMKVWQSLQSIPYGQSWSYKQQAHWLGCQKSVRAVACANGRNKISILIPCHRVIGSDGSLTGYAGGISRKKYLLDLENQVVSQDNAPPFNTETLP